MALDGRQFQRIHDALLDGYNETTLQQMVKFEMNEDLDRVVGPGSLEARVFALVRWADRSGRIRELVQAAHNRNQTNEALEAVYQEWFAPATVATSGALPVESPLSPQVFLAYSSKDKQLMQQLQRMLVDAGFSVWTDEGLRAGTHRWEREIRSAIERTRCMVVILTPDAEQSDWVTSEVLYAQELKRAIFPVLVRGEPRESVPLSLFAVQRIDARQDYTDAVSNKLLPALSRYLNLVGTAPSERATEDETRQAVQVAEEPAEVEPQPVVEKPAARRTPARTPRPAIEFDWVTIPAGEFLMGSDKKKDSKALDRETPQHKIHLPEYRIVRGPVTNAQYKAFVDATAQATPRHWQDGRIPKGKENHPVVYVTWHDAMAFCKWAGVRLPTEAEWEKAARGTDGRIYPWGDEEPTDKLCNFGRNVGDTTPVGKYSPGGDSPYKVADMAGNVWEWTSSLLKPYPYDPSDGKEDPEAGGNRTLRGGSWDDVPVDVRAALRYQDFPDYAIDLVGFRVVVAGSPGS